MYIQNYFYWEGQFNVVMELAQALEAWTGFYQEHELGFKLGSSGLSLKGNYSLDS